MRVGAPHPEKVRRAIVRAFYQEGFTYEEIARVLDIGVASVSRILRLHRETGGIEPRPRGGGWVSPISGAVAEELRRLVAMPFTYDGSPSSGLPAAQCLLSTG